MINKTLWEKLNEISDEEELDDLDFDDKDIETPTEEELAFANEIKAVFQELIDSEERSIEENFRSRSRLVEHFNKHCLGLRTDRQSRGQRVFYDFRYINQYKDREDRLIADVDFLRHSSKNLIPSLVEEDEVIKSFRNFFEGSKYLIIPAREGLKRDGKEINLVLHSFSSDVTTNYHAGNTVDLLIMDANIRTITLTMYPVDANYLENKLNNIINKYCTKHIEPLKINH